MQKVKAILLLFIFGLTLAPWQLVCSTHPLGHDHHEHDKPSPCEIHKQYANVDGQHILPPMECKHSSLIAQDYEPQQTNKLKTPVVQLAIFAAVVFEIISIETLKNNLPVPPEPDKHLKVLISDSPLRGSPLV
ncbi:MAG: hypothetical protein K0B10_02620 [Vicingaceae bacterium]|nr:hypothetical protein [Vicingaceae bacterium]